MAYQNFSLPPAFVAHALRTPPQDLWIPNLGELLKAGIVTAVAPDAALTVSTPGQSATKQCPRGLGGLEGTADSRRFTLDHLQISPRRRFRLPTPLFPVLERRQRDVKLRGELSLR